MASQTEKSTVFSSHPAGIKLELKHRTYMKFIKIVLYISGLVLFVGIGFWSEINSGKYPLIEQQHAAKKIQKK